MTWTSEVKNLGGFVLAFVIVLGVSFLSYQSAKSLTMSHQRVARTQKVATKIEEIHSLIRDGQAGTRGYLLTGDKTFLEPFDSAIDRLPRAIAIIRELTADNPHQQRLVNTLDKQLGKILASFAHHIELRQSQEGGKEVLSVSHMESKKIVDRTLQTLDEMNEEEQSLLSIRTQDGLSKANMTMFVIILGNLLAMGIIGWGLLRIRGELRSRKAAEEQLALEKARLHFAITGANIGTWHWNIVNHEIIFSDQTYALFGIPPNAVMTYERFLEALHPEDRGATDQAVKKALLNRQDYSVDYRTIWPDGSIHWIAAKGRGYYDSSTGQATRMEGIVLDITTRKQAEEVLQRSRNDLERQIQERTAELKTRNNTLEEEIAIRQSAEKEITRLSRQNTLILHAIEEGIYGIDLDEKTTFINHAGAKMLGYQPAELLGRLVHAKVHHTKSDGTPYPREECPMYAAFKDGSVHHVEDEVLWRKDGTCFPVQYTSTPIRDEYEEIVGAVVAFSDITMRKRAEHKFRGLLESAPDAMVIINQKGEIVLVNAQMEHLFGYRREEVLGHPVELLIPERFHRPHTEKRSAFFENPLSRAMGKDRELFARRKDGSELPIEISLSPLETEDGLLVSAAIRDITVRKQVEIEIKLKNQDLETLIYVISHDLGEPLRAIQNFSQLVHDRYMNDLEPKAQDYLERVINGSKRMSTLLQEVLTLSRVQRLGPSEDTIETSLIVEETLKLLEDTIRHTEAKIHVAHELPPILADKRWATQAVYNLLANALKFTESGRPPDVEIEPFEGNETYSLEVGLVIRDRGPGVAPAHAERIFKIFQRAVGREVSGTGAGLAIVRQVALRHGGHAWVEPREGGGSSFYLTFGSTKCALATE